MTAVHQACTTIASTLKPALPDWQVLNTWNDVDDIARRTLVIGWTPIEGGEAVTATVAPDEGGLHDLVEVISIRCSAVAWDGNIEYPPKRAEVAAMLTAIRGKLSEDPKLGGFAFDAYLAPTVQWYLAVKPETEEAPAQANVEVDFTITVTVHAP